MVLLGPGKDYHVVQVDKGISQVKLTKAILHEPLEHCRSITKPVWHPQELIHPPNTHCKGSVLLGFLSHLDLPEAQFQIHGREELGTHHGLHGLLHLREGKNIFLSLVIYLTEVNAKLEVSILLAD